ATANTGIHGTQVGCSFHHAVATNSRNAQIASSTTTAHQGASRPLAAYRKNTQAIPAMPTNGHGETALAPRLRRAATSVLEVGVVPVGIVVPLLVAFLRLLQRPLGLLL